VQPPAARRLPEPDVARILAIPGVRETVNVDHIKKGYYSIKALNPSGIVPLGPEPALHRGEKVAALADLGILASAADLWDECGRPWPDAQGDIHAEARCRPSCRTKADQMTALPGLRIRNNAGCHYDNKLAAKGLQ
jgi:hypothetical protein